MTFLAHAARWLLRRPPIRRRLVSILAVLAIATGSVSTTRPAWAPTAVEYAIALSLIIVVALAVEAIGVGNHDEAQGSSMSCPVFAGSGTLLGEDECIWAKAAGQRVDQSGTSSSTALFRIGGQKQVAPDWFLAGAFGAGSRWSQDGSGGGGTGQVFDGSIALKHTMGPWLFGGALALSSSAMHLTPAGTLQGDANVHSGGLRLRGAYDFAFAGWYLRPRLDLDLIHTWRPGFTLTGQSLGGSGMGGLAVDGFAKTSFVATPMVELGGRYDVDEKVVMRPFVAMGASFLPDNNSTTSAAFTGPLAAVGTMQSTSNGPSVLGNIEAGLHLYKVRGLEVKAEYRLSAGDNYLSQGAGLRGAWHF
jgi:hypothetical protein